MVERRADGVGEGWDRMDDVGLHGGFGVAVKQDGKTLVDEVTLKALGLKARR